MKVFAFHGGFNGISQYRIWNPANALENHGFEVRQIDKSMCHVELPPEGSKIPGIPSYEDVGRWADVVFATYNANLDATARIVGLSEMMKDTGKKGVVIDLDDDIFSITKDNQNYAAFNRSKEWFRQNGLIEVPDGEDGERIAAERGLGLTEKDGKKYIVVPMVDPKQCVIEQIKSASAITVSTEHLAAVYCKFNPKVAIVPNAIDFSLWPENRKIDDGLIRIGLFGANAHYQDWKLIADVVKQVLRDFDNVAFCFNSWINLRKDDKGNVLERTPYVPDFFEELINHPRTFFYEPCQIDEWPRWLADKGCDLAVAPLVDNNFNAAKSNLKWLEYSTLGIPAVYSSVRAFGNVRHGENGLRATKPADFYTGLKRLITEADLRKRIADTASREVRLLYNADKMAGKLGEFLRGL